MLSVLGFCCSFSAANGANTGCYVAIKDLVPQIKLFFFSFSCKLATHPCLSSPVECSGDPCVIPGTALCLLHTSAWVRCHSGHSK